MTNHPARHLADPLPAIYERSAEQTMSELFARLKEVEGATTVKRRTCRMKDIIDGLEPETASLLTKLLDNRKVSTRVIYNALRSDGIGIDRQRISEHRNGDCPCRDEEQS